MTSETDHQSISVNCASANIAQRDTTCDSTTRAHNGVILLTLSAFINVHKMSVDNYIYETTYRQSQSGILCNNMELNAEL